MGKINLKPQKKTGLKQKYHILKICVPSVVSPESNKHSTKLGHEQERKITICQFRSAQLKKKRVHANTRMGEFAHTLGTVLSVLNCILVRTGLTTVPSTMVVSYLGTKEAQSEDSSRMRQTPNSTPHIKFMRNIL